MNLRLHLKKTVAQAALLAAGAAALATAQAADAPAHIRGTITAATPTQLTVQTATGSATIGIDATTRIAGVVPSSLDQIKEGSFVGIANVPGATTSSALEVVVFPDAMKGAGLGDRPWDLAAPSAKPSAMTNGTVKARAASDGKPKSAMTNGTVKKTSTEKGLVLTVDYGNGEKQIQVPANVPVVGIVPADASKLLPGAHVFIAPKPDAPQAAAFVSVGIDGTVPPM